MSKQRSATGDSTDESGTNTRRRFLFGLAATMATGAVAGCSSGDGGSTTTAPDEGPGGGGTATDTPTETATAADTDEPSDSETTTAESPGPRTIEDLAGRTVEIPGTVDRVIPLSSGALRMVAYADATDNVVGVEQLETRNQKRPFRPYNHANPDLAETTSIGSRKNPEPELILQQDPDVIFYAWAKAGKADKLQKQLEIPVVVIRPGDLNPELRDDFFATMRLVGDVLGTADAAESVIQSTEDLMADLNERTTDVPKSERPTSYVGYLGRGKHGFNYTQPLYPPFHFVNANNVASDVTEDLKKKKGAARVTIDPEQIIKWNPEYVFIDTGTEKYDALENPEYQAIEGIEQGNVYGVFPTRDYSINFGTAFANAYYIGTVLYPDRFSDVDPAAKADEIYEQFVGAPVYEDVANSYGQGYGRMDV